MRHGLLLTAFWVVAAQSVLASTGAAGSARSALETFTDGLQALHAAFEQTIIGPEGRMESSGSGQVWLARPGLFRWDYEGDFPEVIVADGRNIWMHDVVMEQVTVKSQSTLAQDSPLSVLTDIAVLDQQFNVRELGQHEGMLWLELTAKAQESEFERVLLGMEGDALGLMVMEDTFGLRTELRFSDVRRNPELDPGLFLFEPPEGADIIGSSEFSE